MTESSKNRKYVDCRSDDPQQFPAVGWVKGKPFLVIYEVREDQEGECYHLSP